MLALLPARSTIPKSLDLLGDAIWPERPLDASPRSIQTYVAQFRRFRGITTSETGYQARPVHGHGRRAPVRAAVVNIAGDHGDDNRQLEEGLSWWRGPAREFAEYDWARPLAARWEAVRPNAGDR
jgi:hypothetical protein